MMRMLYLLLTLFLWVVPAQATIFFDTDFETCTVDATDGFPCEGWTMPFPDDPNYLKVVSGTAHTGSKSVRFHYDNINGNPDHQPKINHSIPATTHVFLRAAIRQDAGFQTGSNGGSKRIRFRPANTNNPNQSPGALGAYPIFWLYNYFGAWTVNIEHPCDELPGQYWITAGGITPSQFDQVEVEIFMNTNGQFNGGLRIWVNGTLRASSLNRKWVSATSQGTCPSSSGDLWHPSDWFTTNTEAFLQSGNGELYYDRIATGDTRIGLTGAQPTIDTTNPTPPTSVAVQ